MKKKLTDKRRKILRWIYGTLSFTTALFVFQACYGSLQDFGNDAAIHGYVKSKTSNQRVPGIKVTVNNEPQYEVTDSTGFYMIYVPVSGDYTVRFEDIDGVNNGSYLPKDTLFHFLNEEQRLNVYLNDK
jgi:hypothetical protein